MKIIKGINKSEFINDYCNRNKEIEFLLVDTIDNGYPFESGNLLILESNKESWLKDLINANDELPTNVEFFLFTNDELKNIDKYKDQLKEFNREIFLVLKADCKAQIENL